MKRASFEEDEKYIRATTELILFYILLFGSLASPSARRSEPPKFTGTTFSESLTPPSEFQTPPTFLRTCCPA